MLFVRSRRWWEKMELIYRIVGKIALEPNRDNGKAEDIG